MTSHNLRRSAAVGAAVALVVAVLAVAVGGFHVLSSTYRVSAVFANVNGLTSGSPVEVAGVTVGSVSGLSRTDQGRAVRVVMSISKSVTLADNTRASIGLLDLLGQQYVDLRYGAGAPPMQAGTVIPASRTSSTPSIDQLLNSASPVFQHVDTTAINAVVGAFDNALRGRSGQVRQLVANLGHLSGVLSAQSAAVAQLLQATSSLSTNLDSHQQALTGAIDNFSAVLGILQQRSQQLTALVDGVGQLSGELTPLLQKNQAPISKVLSEVVTTAQTLDSVSGRISLALDQLPTLTQRFVNVTDQGSWVNVYIVGIVATPYLSGPVNLGDGSTLNPGTNGGVPRLGVAPPVALPSFEVGGVQVNTGSSAMAPPPGYPNG